MLRFKQFLDLHEGVSSGGLAYEFKVYQAM